MNDRRLLLPATLACALAAVCAHPSGAQAPPGPAAFTCSALPAGVECRGGAGTVLRVTALRNDVLRVRLGAHGALPADESWAVLPQAREASAQVTAEQGGFSTGRLRVRVGGDGRLTVTDQTSGRVLEGGAEAPRWDGTRWRVTEHMGTDDHFFGLGDKPGPLDRAGEAFAMWNTDHFGWQESTDPIYKSVPFFLHANKGMYTGVLVDNTFRSFFDFGREREDRYSFGAVDGPVDYYLLYGPGPKAVVEGYAWLTGPTPLPPLWSLGFQQSRYSYMSRARLEEVAYRLRGDKIPADALYLDIDFQDHNRPFTVNAANYPDFRGMVEKLKQKQFHLVVITDLHIAKQQGQGYAPYDTGVAGDEFVKNPDGSTYVGTVWPGPAVFPDFTEASARAWWGTLYAGFAKDGVAGFWNDMNEPAVFGVPSKTMPDDVQHRIDEPGFRKRVATHAEIHNVYGMQNSRGTYEGLLKLEPDVRPFVLTRASYAGGQRYAATWTGDNSSTWNHLRMTVPQLENLGLSGFAMSGADVGGFAGSPSPELLTKWLEVSAFQPIDRDHAAKGTRDHEPWVDGPGPEAVRRRFIEERYRLMPYLYTTAEQMSRTGLPILRPLFLEFPDATSDGRPFDLDAGGEFLFGPDLLVAPNPSPEEVAQYEVHLPPGVWYDWWTGERFERQMPSQKLDLEQRDQLHQPKPLLVTPKLEELPVYVHGGAIVPLAPLTQSTEEKPDGPLVLRVYPGADGRCEGELYADDGISFAFKHGDYLRVHMHCTPGADGALQVEMSKAEGSYRPWWKRVRVEVVGRAPVEAEWRREGTVVSVAAHS